MKGAIMLSGGGSGKLFAAIGVTYPAGSTLTCTNGTKTLTAKTTSGQWVFSIPETGTWTVTATDGTNTSSKSVVIISEGQFESVKLSYGLYLYNNGVIETDISGGLKATKLYGSDGTYNLINENNVLTASAKYTYGSNGLVMAYSTVNKINLAEYSTLVLVVKSTTISDEDMPSVGVNTSLVKSNIDKPVYLAKTDITRNLKTQTTFTLDISSINKECYVFFDLYSGAGGPAEMQIVSWLLEE